MLVMYLIVCIFAILAIYPIFWLLIQSFKANQDYMLHSKLAFPEEWFYRNYLDSWRMARFDMLIINSLFYTSFTVVLVIFLSFMAGFAFAKLPSKMTPVLHGSFIVGILLTLQSILVPLYLMLHRVGLYNTRIGVLIPYVGIGLPIAIYLSTEYIKGIPDAIIESARIDGAKYLHIFRSIIMPIAAPVAATVAILGVTGTWNEFMLINILVSKNELKSLPVGINMFSGARASDFGKQFAALVIGMSPMVAFYLVFRKRITTGVAAGAVKA